MSKRHEMIGIKQAIRLEWMQKAVDLMLAGLNPNAIRQELHAFLADRKGDGSQGERGAESRTQVVNMLMNSWVTPAPDLIPIRDDLLIHLAKHPRMHLPAHWAMLSAAYPFWFNVARQTGRLLTLQDQVAQSQVFNRLKEQYGDRQTVSRYARYVLRSFIFWGVLEDAESKGCYKRAEKVSISEPNFATLMLESALLTSVEGKGALKLLLSNPAFFPFQFPLMTGDYISNHSKRIEVLRYGIDEDLLKLTST